MKSRAILSIVLSTGVLLGTTGCMQFGEYAMGAECSDLAEDVVELVGSGYGTKPTFENMWAGEAGIWCRFDVITNADIAPDDASRLEMQDEVLKLLERSFDGGVQATLVYAADRDVVLH